MGKRNRASNGETSETVTTKGEAMDTATSEAVRIHRSRDNPPYYLVIGVRIDNGKRLIIARQETIGRARKFLRQMDQMIREFYSDVELVRAKSVTVSE